MSPELTTCYGTAVWAELDEGQRLRLTQSEAVNFFSLNVHLIRELIGEVASRIYTTRYPELSEFFHDFIAEENEHMWFFATFCRRYGGKLYPARRIVGDTTSSHDVLRDVTVFGRILIAEELCDYFNARMADDDRLPEIAKQINAVHHQDESRHIAFGRQIMRALKDEAALHVTPEELAAAGDYLARYISGCLRSFYNPATYIDAGLPRPRTIRGRLLSDPGRQRIHQEIMSRTVGFLQRIGVLPEQSVVW
jgi:hypothetical protein